MAGRWIVFDRERDVDVEDAGRTHPAQIDNPFFLSGELRLIPLRHYASIPYQPDCQLRPPEDSRKPALMFFFLLYGVFLDEKQCKLQKNNNHVLRFHTVLMVYTAPVSCATATHSLCDFIKLVKTLGRRYHDLRL